MDEEQLARRIVALLDQGKLPARVVRRLRLARGKALEVAIKASKARRAGAKRATPRRGSARKGKRG